MRRIIIKIIAFLLFVTLLLSGFTGCSITGNKPAQTSQPGQPESTRLEFYLPTQVSDQTGLGKVLDEFYKQTRDTLNVSIKFNFTSIDDIGNTVEIKLGAGEQVDSIFSAQWTTPNLMQMVSKGQLVNLDKYFYDEKNKGLKSAFSKDYLENNMFTDSTGESHIYGIPFTYGFTGGSVFYYRKDLAIKYGINKISSIADLTNYYEQIVKNEKGMVPLSIIGTQDEISYFIYQMMQPTTQEHNYDLNVSGIDGTAIAIRPDGTAYVARKVNYWSDNEFTKLLPEPLKSMNSMVGYQIAREWYTKGYLERDVLSQKDSRGQFMSGKAASFMSTIDQYYNISKQIKDYSPVADLGYFVINPALRSGEPGKMPSEFKAWNFAGIPVTSKNIDKTMAFYNWLFSSKSNHDLFEYGVEGVSWKADGDLKYENIYQKSKENQYNFPAYALTWNPTMLRFEKNTPDEVIRIMKNISDTNFFYRKPTTGFSFVTDSVKGEMVNLNDLAAMKRAVGNGVVADIPGYLENIQQEYEKAGYLKVQAELERQLNQFLKKNKRIKNLN